MHRFFLFHSAIFPLLLFLVAKLLLKLKDTAEMLIIAFCAAFALGVGFHLLADAFQSKAVIFPFIGSLVDGTSLDDRLWLAGNSLICLFFSYLQYRRVLKLAGFKRSAAAPVPGAGPGIKPGKATGAVFEVYRDRQQAYRFRLKAANREILLHSEAYTTKAGCLNGIHSVRGNVLSAEIDEI